jgi:hypothetical protein
VSLESAVARLNEFCSAFAAPAAPAPTAPAAAPSGKASGDASFAGRLAQAKRAQDTAPEQGEKSKRAGYPHLSGDLDASPALLRRLEGLAAQRGEKWHVTSGHRTYQEQARLWANRHANPYPVARPGTSRHEGGNAADVTIGGRPIQHVVPAAALRRHGITPLAGDAVHVELAR